MLCWHVFAAIAPYPKRYVSCLVRRPNVRVLACADGLVFSFTPAAVARNASNEYCGIAPTVDRTYISLCTTFLAIAGVFVLLRLIDRLVMGMRSLWWDDLLTFFTLVSTPLLCRVPSHVFFNLTEVVDRC